MDELLAGLNEAQRAAVSSDTAVLQVLAPPGSGKTKTLTARVGYLVARGLRPWNIIVCTFTVKAASEMRERIKTLLEEDIKSKLKIGTFHGLALRYLRQYRQEAELRDNFGVADSFDSLAIVRRIIKVNAFKIEEKPARNRISSLKSKGIDCATYAAQAKNKTEQQIFIQIYSEYQAALEKCNLLDYDDILLRCVSLLKAHPECVSHVEAVLVDEFQDTNSIQYDLMTLFAHQRQFVTIVGDPDQSIYGWRSADIKNLGRMKQRWPDTLTINLEQNYRSSGAILHAAQEVIEQDENRPPKQLQATHSYGHKPVLRKLPSTYCEASWIVDEIKRLQALTGALLKYDDFAVLLRSASLSRAIEQAFGKHGIPYRMIGGTRFYDRKEVQIILDYLRVMHSPSHGEALARVLNVPARSIGEATIEKLHKQAKMKNMTLWTLISASSRGKTMGIKLTSTTERGIAQFANVILTGQRRLEEGGSSLVDLINYIVKKIDLETYLKKEYSGQFESRWANVEELIAHAADVPEATLVSADGVEDREENERRNLDLDRDETDTSAVEESPLCRFLANVALAASKAETSEQDEGQKHIVTISTLHAAKGLEWPVVFVPACYNGSIPHSRSEDHDEERRLLYVGMTRAQALLYLSCPLKDSKKEETTLSNFLAQSSVRNYFDERGASIRLSDAKVLSEVLGRDAPSPGDIVLSSARTERDEDDYWPTSGDYPLGLYEEADDMPAFGHARSAASVDGGTGKKDTSASMPGFSSLAGQYDELMRKQESLTEKKLEKKLKATGMEQPRGRKRQIKGQGTISKFLGKSSVEAAFECPFCCPHLRGAPRYYQHNERGPEHGQSTLRAAYDATQHSIRTTS